MNHIRLETIGVRMVKKHQGDLGKQRIFGVIGQAIFVVFT